MVIVGVFIAYIRYLCLLSGFLFTVRFKRCSLFLSKYFIDLLSTFMHEYHFVFTFHKRYEVASQDIFTHLIWIWIASELFIKDTIFPRCIVLIYFLISFLEKCLKERHVQGTCHYLSHWYLKFSLTYPKFYIATKK